MVQSFLAALDLLYEESDPDWFCLLSGADYPVARAEAVIDELKRATCDAFLDIHQMDSGQSKARMVGNWNPALDHLESDQQYRLKDRFYRKAQFSFPVIRPNAKRWLGRRTLYLPFRCPNPYREGFKLFWGDFWFTANRRTAKLLRTATEDHLNLQRYLKGRVFPDETYCHTLLGNTPHLTICRNNKRFVSWRGGAHPMTLTEVDVSMALASDAHFARKFAPNSPALEMLDSVLLPGGERNAL